MSTTTTDRAPRPEKTAPESLFLRAARGESTARAPIWLMRQAGRYLPEYQKIKRQHDFWTMCSTPELAAEVTLQPVHRYGMDAAVIFTDIMVPAIAMGVPVDFTPGPVISPIRSDEQVAALRVPSENEVAPSLFEAIRLTAKETAVPVIGHAGAPLTFAAYLVTGRKSTDHVDFRTWLSDNPSRAHALLDKVAETSTSSLRMQVAAGARLVQLFDSWVGIHDRATYLEFGLPYAKRIMQNLADLGVPRAYFTPQAAHLYDLVATVPAEVLSVDWRTPLSRSREFFGDRALQGNLDPAVLLAEPETVVKAAETILRDGLGGPHIFNLGHGVLPETPPDNVARLVDVVRDFDRTTSDS
ncbi:uroporphyrinogen decarboxylase [Nocardia brasiliensis]|uniref:uroporphyrinogen decarboxylase n=1 Tax=Nocardia brasiliensis TaxID=37326 RepID=UPI00366E3586